VLSRLGKFEIIRLLAQGSMGEVYVGWDPTIGREVAIKVIHTTAGMGPEARERFATEARAAGALNHPNIVTVHELGEEQGVLYLAMELVRGEDLATLIRAETLLPRDALEVLAQICDGLAVAHRHQILHRDIKPSNIRVLWDGRTLQAKLLDFGVAKVINSDTTDEGTVFGTVNYMAPEYLQSGRPDARSDLFAIGVILYEALAGVPPFDGPSPGSVIYRLLHEAPGPLPAAAFQGISRDVQTVLNVALAKDPSGRFQCAEDLAASLRSAKNPAWRWEGLGQAPGRLRPPAPGLAPPAGTPPGGLALQRTGPQSIRPVAPGKGTATSGPHARSEVWRDVLETTRRQLLQALELDPGNAGTCAMLLVTCYRLGRTDALIQVLRHARGQGLPAADLRAQSRCDQMVREEREQCRLPLELHGEFMAYFEA